jgi:hypothetical protein
MSTKDAVHIGNTRQCIYVKTVDQIKLNSFSSPFLKNISGHNSRSFISMKGKESVNHHLPPSSNKDDDVGGVMAKLLLLLGAEFKIDGVLLSLETEQMNGRILPSVL